MRVVVFMTGNLLCINSSKIRKQDIYMNTYLDKRLYDRSNDESNGKDDKPASMVFILCNSLCDILSDTKFGNLENGGKRGRVVSSPLLILFLLLLRPRRPAVSPMAQLDNRSLVSDIYSNGFVLSGI